MIIFASKLQSMDNISNPFIISGYIPDKYFCDRTQETEWLTSLVTNGNNVVLISPRRMGKSSLIEHCYHKKDISNKYFTFYIDILPTTSLAEMVCLLGKKIYDTLLPRGKKILNNFLSALTSLRGVLGYDALSGLPTLTFSVGNIQNPEHTLEEIFTYLSKSDKPCIVTIDEFQQIDKYGETNVEALLRSHIQKVRNCTFIFSGSERHTMLRMFKDEARPFYNSAEILDLNPINQEIYTKFIIDKFNKFGKKIDIECCHYIYTLMQSNTFYIQRLCNRAFALTSEGKTCDKKIIDDALQQLLSMNETYFNERLSLVPAKHKQLLYAIAKHGACKSILSADFINTNRLTSASAVQYAARQLVDDSLLSFNNGTYSLNDKLLSIYITRCLI